MEIFRNTGQFSQKPDKASLKAQILKGTAILAAAGLITRVLGLYNRVFLANVIGAGALGVYQLIFPVFMVCHAICCSGIETALSRLTAAYSGQGCHGNIRRLVKLSVALSLFAAAVLAAGVFFPSGANQRVYFKGTGMCRMSEGDGSGHFIFSGTFLCPRIFLWDEADGRSGFVTADRTDLPCICYLHIISDGLFGEYCRGGAGCTIRISIAGDVLSCIYTLGAYKLHVRRMNRHEAPEGSPAAAYAVLFRQLMHDALPLTVNRLSLTMLSGIESILIPAMMKLYYTAGGTAMEIYGIVTGMAMPFVMFPTTITNALASLLMPAVAEAAGRRDFKQVNRAVSVSVHYCLLIGIAGMSIFVLYGSGLGMVFFGNALAGEFLSVLAFLCPFMYMSATLTGVLNGLGQTRMALLHNVICVGLRIGFIVVCVPKTGVLGYLWGLWREALLCAAFIFSGSLRFPASA